jgi:hypothetical protein
MASINIKVSTGKLIDGLEKALARREDAKVKYEKDRAQYEKDLEKYEQSLVTMALSKKLVKTSHNVHQSYRDDTAVLTMTFMVPNDLKSPEPPVNEVRTWEMDEIRNALNLLRMSDSETVSTSTYKGVAQYL